MRIPYGCYVLSDDSRVLFDRRYQPIARFSGPPGCPVIIAQSAHTDRVVVLPLDSVRLVPADEWIEHIIDHVWLFDDRTSPARNRRTARTVEALMAAALGAAHARV